MLRQQYLYFSLLIIFKILPVDLAVNCSDADALNDALAEFPIIDRGVFNRGKLGWILKTNANRIINGFEFRKAKADGRNAWRVVKVDTTNPDNEKPFMSDHEKKRVELQEHLDEVLGAHLYKR
jgi:hypothetical protein